MSDLSGPVGDTRPIGPTEHLETVDYWKGLYLDAVKVGQEKLNQLRAELSDVRNERVALQRELAGVTGALRITERRAERVEVQRQAVLDLCDKAVTRPRDRGGLDLLVPVGAVRKILGG